MNTIPSPVTMTPASSYEASRLNATRHGVLSRHAILPWEDAEEYRTLHDALVAEHVPAGPTEHHLVEEIAGTIWRKRRLRIAEIAAHLESLRHEVTRHNSEHIAAAALLPITGMTRHKVNLAQAVATAPAETARELRDVKRDQRFTGQADEILIAGGPDAYARALGALREDTRSFWQECLADPPHDGLTYTPTADALKSWIDRHWDEWYQVPLVELEHRGAIRDQALGIAYATRSLDTLARYEVHLDRKLERVLSVLMRLKELRPAPPNG